MVEAAAQLGYYEKMEDLRTKQEAARAKLTELEDAGDDGWEDLKVRMENAWDDLRNAVKSAASRFK